jgi:hypothetical protein
MGICLKVLRRTGKTSVKIACAPAEILTGNDKDKLQWLSPEQTCAIYTDSYVCVIRNSSFIVPSPPPIKTRHEVSSPLLFCRRHISQSICACPAQTHVIACPFPRVQLYATNINSSRFVKRSASLPPRRYPQLLANDSVVPNGFHILLSTE